MIPERSPNDPKSKDERTRLREDRRRAAFLRKRLTPRVRDVFLDLMKSRKDAGAYLEAQCLKVAELTARAEDLRARLDAMLAPLKGDEHPALDDAQVKSLAALINNVTRLESTARRAAADLGKVAEAKVDPMAEWDAMQAEAARVREEEERAEREANN
jgi:hypothetical protein